MSRIITPKMSVNSKVPIHEAVEVAGHVWSVREHRPLSPPNKPNAVSFLPIAFWPMISGWERIRNK